MVNLNTKMESKNHQTDKTYLKRHSLVVLV